MHGILPALDGHALRVRAHTEHGHNALFPGREGDLAAANGGELLPIAIQPALCAVLRQIQQAL